MMAGQAPRADIEMAFLAIAPAGGKTGNQQVVIVMSTCDGTSTPAKRAFYLLRINNATTWRSAGFELFTRSSEACTADVDVNDRLWNAQLARHCVHRHFGLYYHDCNRVRFFDWLARAVDRSQAGLPSSQSFSWLSHVVGKVHLAHRLVIE
ncbi:hypothetical protein ABH994_005695 [Bradyrhizobium yuanmingense]|uniref:hypothetical protein n=1 Tax=Bradyrhizobium yuanmingense TaxID=108015 RepID=UPI0035184758